MSMTFAAPKDIDNVLLRIPAIVKQQAVEAAASENVSANSLYAAGVLYATLIYGVLPQIGSPQNLLALVAELDQAIAGDGSIMGAFSENDWADIHWIVDMLYQIGWIDQPMTRQDVRAASTIVYALRLTKTGRTMWPQAALMIKSRFNTSNECLVSS
jgi:hypothetical protein